MQGVVERHGGYSSSRLGLVGSGVSVSSSAEAACNFNGREGTSVFWAESFGPLPHAHNIPSLSLYVSLGR